MTHRGDTLPVPHQKELIRAALSRSFWSFFQFGFGAYQYCQANPQDNWVSPSLHWQICNWLDYHVREWMDWRARGIRKPKKIMLEIFRGGGKSTIGCALDLYLQINLPNLAEIISSYDKEQSKAFLAVDKTVMEGANKYGWWKDLWGSWAPNSDERVWQTEKLVHMFRENPGVRDYSFAISSVGKGITGTRPDVFRYDDPIVREKITEDATFINKAREHLDSAGYAVKSNGLYLVYLTPYASNDVAGKVWMEEGVATVAGQQPPFEYKHDPDGWHVFYMPVRDLQTMKSVIPQVYPDEYLDALEAKDPDDFASQMMCNPAAGQNVPLKQEDIDPLYLDPHEIPRGLEISIHCDTAFKDAKSIGRGDQNVIQEWHHARSTGKVYYRWGVHNRTWTGREFIHQLVIRLQDLYKLRTYPFVVTVDKSPGGLKNSFQDQLYDACVRHGIPCPAVIELDRSNNIKDARIRNAVYYWKSGVVRLDRSAPGLQQLTYEMTNIGYAALKDMADAAADVFDRQVYTPAPSPLVKEDPLLPHPYDEEMWGRPGEPFGDVSQEDYDQFLRERMGL